LRRIRAAREVRSLDTNYLATIVRVATATTDPNTPMPPSRFMAKPVAVVSGVAIASIPRGAAGRLRGRLPVTRVVSFTISGDRQSEPSSVLKFRGPSR
jgi:hypothetical protein